jgi:hypothetical protein
MRFLQNTDIAELYQSTASSAQGHAIVAADIIKLNPIHVLLNVAVAQRDIGKKRTR